MAWWYLVITSSAVKAAYTQAFLDAFSSLGIEPWAGIEMDVAWGQTTLRFGLHRPSVTGPIFVYRVCTSFRQDAPTRMQVLSHADLSPDQLLSAIAGQYPDLRDTWADGGWQLCAIDATRGHSRDRSLMHPCYILVQVDDYWAFNHRPHALFQHSRKRFVVLQAGTHTLNHHTLATVHGSHCSGRDRKIRISMIYRQGLYILQFS